jgi:ubiquinone/menaquinone biosynthesis C-methylase UbiE
MNEDRDSVAGRYQLTHEVGFINRFVGNLYQPKILLDACCGSGSVSLLIQCSDFHAIGLDTNLLALNGFREQSREASLTLDDALCMSFVDVSIDCIIAVHCFDHLNRVRFLQECNRLLCGGGF